jgi:hypothetical protein
MLVIRNYGCNLFPEKTIAGTERVITKMKRLTRVFELWPEHSYPC